MLTSRWITWINDKSTQRLLMTALLSPLLLHTLHLLSAANRQNLTCHWRAHFFFGRSTRGVLLPEPSSCSRSGSNVISVWFIHHLSTSGMHSDARYSHLDWRSWCIFFIPSIPWILLVIEVKLVVLWTSKNHEPFVSRFEHLWDILRQQVMTKHPHTEMTLFAS